jgi:hypothetical protein
LEERSVSTGDEELFDSEVPAQTTEGVSPEAPESQPRDEQGKWTAKDTGESAPATGEPQGAPPAPAEKRHDVPITALLDERDKRQRLEQQLAAYQARERAQQQPREMPNPVEDAEGYTRTLAQTFEQRLQASALKQSEFFAKREFGAELVDEAMAYFDNQPRHVSEQFLAEASPFHAAVEWFKQQKEVSERASPDFEAKLRAKLRAEWEAERAESPSTRPNIPRSLAEAPSTGAPPPGPSDPLFS